MEKQPFKQLGNVPILDSSTPKKEEEVPPKQPVADAKPGNNDFNTAALTHNISDDSFEINDKENMNDTINIPNTNGENACTDEVSQKQPRADSKTESKDINTAARTHDISDNSFEINDKENMNDSINIPNINSENARKEEVSQKQPRADSKTETKDINTAALTHNISDNSLEINDKENMNDTIIISNTNDENACKEEAISLKQPRVDSKTASKDINTAPHTHNISDNSFEINDKENMNGTITIPNTDGETACKEEKDLQKQPLPNSKTVIKDFNIAPRTHNISDNSFEISDKEDMNYTIISPNTHDGNACNITIEMLIERFSRELNMDDSSLRSGSESMLDQNISSYSSTVSMDSLHSSPAVSRHSFPLDIIGSVIDITEPEETLLDINTKPDNKLEHYSPNIAGVLKSSLAVDPSTDEFEDDEAFGDCFDLDKFLPLNSKPSEGSACILANTSSEKTVPTQKETLQEEAPALPLRVAMPICDQQLQITPKRKPRESLLSRFDPFYLSTPNRVLEAKTLGDLEDLVKEQPVLFETQPHDVTPNSETEEQSFNAVGTVTVHDVTITPDSFNTDVPAVNKAYVVGDQLAKATSSKKECSNLKTRTPEITIKDVGQEVPVKKSKPDISHIQTFAEETVAGIIADAVHIVETSIPTADCFVVSAKTMAEVNDKIALQEEENAELKLQLNASQQVRATLELQLRQKEEIIIKSQAETLRKDQACKQEIKHLKEKLEEKCIENENSQSKDLQETIKNLKAREAKLATELNARKNAEQDYRKVMEAYEKNIAEHLSELQKISEENDSVKCHLANLELAFSDVHQKYERSKKIIDGYKCNENALRERLDSLEDTVIKSAEKYETLKAHAKAQIEKSNQEMQAKRDEYETEIHKLSSIIKRLEIKNDSLTESLDQKAKECSALAALCDEMTGKRV